MAAAGLTCPHCRAPLAPPELLEACSVAESATGLLRFACPRCGAPGRARVGNGRAEVGAAGAEGTPLQPVASAEIPGLFVRAEPEWVDCWLGPVYRRFPAGG